MATLVLGAVGTAIGGAFGGAILGFSGAAIGGFIGSTIGSVVDSWIVSSLAPAQKIEGQPSSQQEYTHVEHRPSTASHRYLDQITVSCKFRTQDIRRAIAR